MTSLQSAPLGREAAFRDTFDGALRQFTQGAQAGALGTPGNADGLTPRPVRGADNLLTDHDSQWVQLSRVLLGHGAMGCVHMALDLTTGDVVAAKRVTGSWAGELMHETRMAHRAGSRLAPPRVLDDGMSFIALAPLMAVDMWHVNLDVMDAAVRAGVAIGAMLDLLPALVRMHARGIAHSDVKPANILLRAGRMHLTDFGLACEVADPRPPSCTSAYAPPEVFEFVEGRGHDRVDVYALGMSVLQWLGGPAGRRLVMLAVAAPEAVARELVAVRCQFIASPTEAQACYGMSLAAAPAPLQAVLTSMLDTLPGQRPSAADVLQRLFQRDLLALANAPAVAAWLTSIEAVRGATLGRLIGSVHALRATART